MDFHDVANIFPLMNGDEFDALKADIAKNGQREPIWMWQDKIIDGRNRWRACADLGLVPVTREWDGNGSLVAFVVSLNLHRRHLSSSQRAAVAVDMLPMLEAEAKENMRAGGMARQQGLQRIENPERHSAQQAAELTGTNRQYVADMKKLKAEEPETFEKVRDGELTVSRAMLGIRRAERLEKIIAGNAPLPNASQKYNLIYADPPWQYEHIETESRAIENQYPTMPLYDICNLPVADLCANDCVLFLWATSPKLAEAMAVLGAWGFDYRTCMVWVKDKIGMGYYARQQHELLLIAVKGSLPTPEPANRPSSVIEAPRGVHSRKPEVVYELLERMYPEVPKIELFCRTPREGWAVWGNQA